MVVGPRGSTGDFLLCDDRPTTVANGKFAHEIYRRRVRPDLSSDVIATGKFGYKNG